MHLNQAGARTLDELIASLRHYRKTYGNLPVATWTLFSHGERFCETCVSRETVQGQDIIQLIARVSHNPEDDIIPPNN